MDSKSSTAVSHKRIIIHIDMDYFYAQVEELQNPLLKHQPLGVQQKNIVVTSNYVARNYGIKKLMLVNEAKKLCPELVLVNGEDLSIYRQMSNKIFELLHKYTPLVEKLGLDENFLDVTEAVNCRLHGYSDNFEVRGNIFPENGCLKECSCGCGQRLCAGTHLAKEIRDDLQRTLKITCCAGIAHNKLLAKLVGGINKPNNQTVLVPTAAVKFMRQLGSLRRITGIGQKTEAQLKECGIITVSDLQDCDVDVLCAKLGSESALKLRNMAFGIDSSEVRPSGKPKTIGLEDSCKPISVRKDVEERFRLLLMRLVGQVSEDGRIPISIKIIIRKFDSNRRSSHRETKQANILPSLFKQLQDGKISLVDGAQEQLLKIIMRLFERVVDMQKPFNITLLGLAFSKFQSRRFGSSSIANFLIKKSDLEVQSVMNLKSEGMIRSDADEFGPKKTTLPISTAASDSIPTDVSDFSETEIEPSPKKSRIGTAAESCNLFKKVSDPSCSNNLSVGGVRCRNESAIRNDCSHDHYRRTITPSPIPMLADVESVSSDISDFSETEIEPPSKKTRIGLIFARRCRSSNDVTDIASPSKLRVAELRLNSRDSEKDVQVSSQIRQNKVVTQSLKTSALGASTIAKDFQEVQSGEDNINSNDSIVNGTNNISEEIVTTTITGNLANIPCPSGVDPSVFKELPRDVQTELISSWRTSVAAKAAAGHATGSKKTNTLYRYFIKNK